MSDYPEHEKLSAISDKSQAIYDFLMWCAEEKGAELATWAEEGLDRMWPLNTAKRELLAEYFGIDLNKLEDEKRAMLDEMRRANAGEGPR